MLIGQDHSLICDLLQVFACSLEEIFMSCKSKKMSVVSRSSAKSEYRAMANVTCEMAWVRDLITEFGLDLECHTRLYCDNQAAIY